MTFCLLTFSQFYSLSFDICLFDFLSLDYLSFDYMSSDFLSFDFLFFASTISDLGLRLNTKLTFAEQVEKAVRKVNGKPCC